MSTRSLLIGAVAYDPRVVTIWEGFRRHFNARGLPMDYILYSNYERQVEELLAGHIDLAWNSPLAWVRCQQAASTSGLPVSAVAMRDTDRDLRSVILVRADGPLKSTADLRGQVVAVGAADSPQATILPLAHLRSRGLTPGTDFQVLQFDVLTGLHGDHVGGEREAARALVDGRAAAACMIEANYLAFLTDGTLPPLTAAVLDRTEPYDHCNMTAGPAAQPEQVSELARILLSMSYEDPEVRPLFDLEGLRSWVPGRTEGYALLHAALAQTPLP